MKMLKKLVCLLILISVSSAFAQSNNGSQSGLYQQRGFINQELKLYDDALSDFERAIKLNPLNLNAYKGRADLYLAMGNKKLAMNDYQFIIKNDDKGILKDVYISIAEMMKADNDFAGALELYKKALDTTSLQHNFVLIKILYEKANCEGHLKIYEDAADDYTVAIAIYEKSIQQQNENSKFSGFFNESFGNGGLLKTLININKLPPVREIYMQRAIIKDALHDDVGAAKDRSHALDILY
jgi:tetratricopeptide (TPR) repeat protein